MSMPHTCRCNTCGAEGIIIPNTFDSLPRVYGGTGEIVNPHVLPYVAEPRVEDIEGLQHHVATYATETALVPVGTIEDVQGKCTETRGCWLPQGHNGHCD